MSESVLESLKLKTVTNSQRIREIERQSRRRKRVQVQCEYEGDKGASVDLGYNADLHI